MSDDDAGEIEYVTPSKEYLRRRLQVMDPYAFEEFVADVWEHLGWHTRVVGEPGDQGIDVIATDGEDKQLIQAKRYGPNTTVGSPEVQQYASLRLQEENVNQVTIVTTGEFSRQAEELAPDLDVILVDGENLLGILEELEAFEVFVEHFDDIQLESAADADTREREDESLLGRIQSWLG
ncbi:restriction endonuclease [Halorientalis litorea]|uniref:restriction endonuclease n=1 Tax=Halorientalis litorea TaxID=2931977 RepID=UPI001FF25B1F|nr:restriction endonuclease [Halorientalis litorea]